MPATIMRVELTLSCLLLIGLRVLLFDLVVPAVAKAVGPSFCSPRSSGPVMSEKWRPAVASGGRALAAAGSDPARSRKRGNMNRKTLGRGRLFPGVSI